jgi:hypothetical protein
MQLTTIEQREIADAALGLVERGANLPTRAMFHALTIDRHWVERTRGHLSDAFTLRDAMESTWDELPGAVHDIVGSPLNVHGGHLHSALVRLVSASEQRHEAEVDPALD